MALSNMFEERVDKFNEENEAKRLAELFDKTNQMNLEWETYSIADIQELLSVTEEEALKLFNSGLFKTYRVGNEYRASRKSVKENQRIIETMLTYQKKKTITVPDVMRLLGLGKTSTYRLINQCKRNSL